MSPGRLFLLVLLVGCLPVHAQSGKAEVQGLVRDPEGLPVSGARVTLLSAATGAQFTAESDAAGLYHIVAVEPGRYSLTAAKRGFRTEQRPGLRLRVSDRVQLDIALVLGDMSQTIEVVSSGAPLLETARGPVSLSVDRTKVASVPLNGRNFVPLIGLSAGVMLPPGSVLPRINGSRPRVSEYLYDGVSVLQPEPGQVAYFPVIDAIEEFRVDLNSYSAEFGRSNGGVIQVRQKSGSNELRGTLFEFFRNEALNARNLFATEGGKPRFRRNQYGAVLGGPVQKDRTFFFADWQGTRLDTGAVRTSTVPTSTERSGRFATPVFDPGTTRSTPAGYVRDAFEDNRIPESRFDRGSAALLGRYPLPNVFAGGQEARANNYRRVADDTTSQDQFDARLDRNFGVRQRVFGRYSYLRDNGRPTPPLPDGSGNLTSGLIGRTLSRADSVVIEHTATLGAAQVNELRAGYTRRAFDRSALLTGAPASQLTGVPNLPAASFGDALPVFLVAGYQQLGPPSSANARFGTSVTQVVDTFTHVHGAHSTKLGVDTRVEHLDVLEPPNPTGQFQFSPVLTAGLGPSGATLPATGSSVASFLLGQVESFSADVQQQVLQPRAKIAEFFVQDDWRIAPRWFLNLGVRYTLNFPSTEAHDRAAVFDLRTQKLNFLGRDGHPRNARNLEKGDFGPRLGFAYRVTGSFVVRAGYGLTWIEQAGITTPFTTPLFPFIQTIAQPSLDNLSPAFVLSSGPGVRSAPPGPDSGVGEGVFAVQRDNGSGYAQQWNFTLQKTFAKTWSLTAGYMGSKLTRLGVPDVNINQLRMDQLKLGNALTRQVPNPFYGQIGASSLLGAPMIAAQQLLRPFPRFTAVTMYRDNVGHSTYHSLQAQLEKRLSAGLTFTAAYTFSKLIDDAGAVFDSAILTGPVLNYQAADSFNRRLEKDESTGSIPHVFSSGFVYDLPFGQARAVRLRGWRDAVAGGWRVAGIARLQSGSPLAITQATNYNAFAGFGIQRPNRVGDANLPADQRTTGRYFNTVAFAVAPQFTLGNSSRNPVRGPGYHALDVALSKDFVFRERYRAELRGEAFNVTNTPPLANPNGSFGSPGFGSITTALDPRVFELAVKLHF